MCVEATEEPRWDGFRGVWGFLPAIPLKVQDIHGFWMFFGLCRFVLCYTDSLTMSDSFWCVFFSVVLW